MKTTLITFTQQGFAERSHGEKTSKRICGLDLIRVCAIFFVIAGHFFSLNTSYRNVPFEGTSMFLQGMLAELFTGVPLFYMLTGYLNINKTISKKYYRGMLRVIISYIIFSVITITFRKYYLHDELSFSSLLMKIFDYSAIPYAWFVEMWIGLALLTPFLNYLYKAIPTRQEKLIGIFILFALTALPDLLNRYGMYIAPGYWGNACFPLMFFFFGAFIREYQPVINWKWGLALILTMISITPLFNIILFEGHDVVDITGGSRGVFSTWVTVTIFLLLYRKDIPEGFVRNCITHCSKVSYEMYLCCFMFDRLYYPWFKAHFFESQSQYLAFFFVLVPLVFLSSYLVAALYNYCSDWIKNFTSPKLSGLES